jgi:ABC-type transport system involved in cytochrome c biogenesis ATPase subunit
MARYEEVIDERLLDAARFGRRILDSCKATPLKVEDGLRLAIFLMYLRLAQDGLAATVGDDASNPDLRYNPSDPSWIDPGRLDRLRRDVAERLSVQSLDYLGIVGFPLNLILHLFELVNESRTSDVLVFRFDHLCELLWEKQTTFPNAIKVEKFIAAFASRWVSKSDGVVDGNASSSGQLGTSIRVKDLEYYVIENDQPLAFELALRLLVHRVSFHRVSAPSLYVEGGRRPVHSFIVPTLGRARSMEGPVTPDSWRGSGHEAIEWFLQHAGVNQQAAILFSSAELRAKGWRTRARNELLAHGIIQGVLELPSRVAGRNRLCLVFVRKSFSGERAGRVLFVDGRALDGLQDETLDRLAQFVSIPFSALDPSRGDGTWEDWEQDLGVDLEVRAKKMYLTSNEPIPGFMTRAPVGEILDFHPHSLVPEDVIPRRDAGGPSAALDGRSILTLLRTTRSGPRCVYIIGDNGVGKSCLLKELSEVLVAEARPVRAVASALADRFRGSFPAPANYLYLGTQRSGAAVRTGKLGTRMAELLGTIYSDESCLFIFNSIVESLGFQGRHYLIPNASRADVLETVVELTPRINHPNLRDVRLGVMKANYNAIVPFDHLSSGEQQVLLLIAKLVAHASREVVFLIDEPETSLHVAWQRALPDALRRISANFGCDVVVAMKRPGFRGGSNTGEWSHEEVPEVFA